MKSKGRPKGPEKVGFYRRVTPEQATAMSRYYLELVKGGSYGQAAVEALVYAAPTDKRIAEVIAANPSPSAEEPYLDPQVKERTTVKSKGRPALVLPEGVRPNFFKK